MLQNLIQQAIQKIDAINSLDPTTISHHEEDLPFALFHSQQISQWTHLLSPFPSPALQIAARSQHIKRWEIPRESYPTGRSGYLKWRSDLKLFHANETEEILSSLKFDKEIIQQVRDLNLKRDLKINFDFQILEDSLCLFFLQFQFESLIAKTPEPKMINIIHKTWGKMSEQGQKEALSLSFSQKAAALLQLSLK